MASGGGGGPPAAPPATAPPEGFTRHTKTTCAIMAEDDESSFGDDDESAPVIATATQIGSAARATEKKRIKHAKDKENARSRALATADAKAAAKPTADAYTPVGQKQPHTLSKKSSGGNPLVDSSTGEVHHATTTDLEITLKTIVSSSPSPLVNRSATAAVSAADSRSSSTSTVTAVSGLETALSSLSLAHGTSRA